MKHRRWLFAGIIAVESALNAPRALKLRNGADTLTIHDRKQLGHLLEIHH